MADWTTDAVDALEQAVGLVRDKTVVPAQNASRAVVSGPMAATSWSSHTSRSRPYRSAKERLARWTSLPAQRRARASGRPA